jgi:hypothetical protein
MSNPYESPEFGQNRPVARRQMRLKRVGVLSLGLFFAAYGALVGLFVGMMMALMSAIGLGAGGMQNDEAAAAMIGMGLGALIFGPIMYGIMGFIGGVIWAVIYNVIAGMTGGIEMEFGE